MIGDGWRRLNFWILFLSQKINAVSLLRPLVAKLKILTRVNALIFDRFGTKLKKNLIFGTFLPFLKMNTNELHQANYSSKMNWFCFERN